MPKLTVEFPAGQTLTLNPTTSPAQSIADLLRRESHPLNTRCGQRGLCDGCMVELCDGTLVHRTSGATATAGPGGPVTVRGCDHGPAGAGPVVLRVPARSVLRYEPQVVTDFRLNVPAGYDPLSDAEPQPGDVGAAVDIGTTTVVVAVVDLTTGKVVSSAAGFNHQVHLGDNVLTRIALCQDRAMLATLRHAVRDQTVIPLLHQALSGANVTADRLRCLSVAGNTTMLHLFAGVDPSPMGVVPFTPPFIGHRRLDAPSLDGFSSPVHLLPGCSAYVGADLAAGTVATGLLYDDGPSLLVDIGTNGEIVLKRGDRLWGTATAAGPAFEGANLASGMRAGAGAVSHVRIWTDPFAVETETIGQSTGSRPTGICGSAYVDFLATARDAGVLTETGRFDPDAAPACAPHLVPWQDHGSAFRIATGSGKQPIVVSEWDVSKLLQAKAAIAAGILILLNRAGIRPEDVKTLYLAGGFGMHVSVPNAIRCGLLPRQFRTEQVQVVGNTSLGGAYLALLDRGLLEEMDRLRRRMTIVELNQDPGFEMCYVDQLMLA